MERNGRNVVFAVGGIAVIRLAVILTLLTTITADAWTQEMLMRRAYGVRGAAVDLTADLWHFWNPGGGGDTNDLGSKPQNVTLNGGLVSSTNGWEMGTNDQYYAVIPGGISNGSAFTIAVWIRPDMPSMATNFNSSGGMIFGDRAPSLSGWDWQISYNPTRNPIGYSWIISDPTNALSRVDSTNALTSSVWQHLVGVCGGGKVALYLNGVVVMSTNLTITPNNSSTNAAIGQTPWSLVGTVAKYHGDIDKVRFYGTAKDAAFIKAIYDSEKASKGL